MAINTSQAVVAGHICLDLIPEFSQKSEQIKDLFKPGKLTQVGPVTVSTGGAVSNTGIALHKLGIQTRLMGKVGDDLFGKAILDVLRGNGENLADDMIVDESVSSSYTLVISPPSVDRLFFHHPGANDMFSETDIDRDIVQDADLFHFGYPPIMKQMYESTGKQLTTLFREIKQGEITTSLDMAFPDPDSDAGYADWHTILENTLPHVDIFLPSMDEIAFMLHHPWSESPDDLPISVGVLDEIANRLLEYGTGIVVLKLGDQGLYVRTPKYKDRLQDIPLLQQQDLDNWTDRELISPCFKTEVAGTTGAGDSTIAGFLAGILYSQPLEQCIKTAVGVGACNVEQPDATSGVPDWNTVQSRIRGDWEILETNLLLENWHFDEKTRLWDRNTG